MNYLESITELIGNTPLLRLNRTITPSSNLVLAKCERQNPLSSIKDRSVKYMIQEAISSHKLKGRDTIIEATSGNAGIAIANLARVMGFRAVLVMPEAMPKERQKLFKLLGAELIFSPTEHGMAGSIEMVQDLYRKNSNFYWLNQFENEANVRAHEETTAKEIWEDTEGKIDTVVVGVGTAGTIMGVSRGLKKKNPKVKIIAVEPESSAVLSGASPGSHVIQGIGAGFIPRNYDANYVDEVIQVRDEDALKMTQRVVLEEGVLVGISSGAHIVAVNTYLKEKRPENETIVTFFCDTGERYLNFGPLVE